MLQHFFLQNISHEYIRLANCENAIQYIHKVTTKRTQFYAIVSRFKRSKPISFATISQSYYRHIALIWCWRKNILLLCVVWKFTLYLPVIMKLKKDNCIKWVLAILVLYKCLIVNKFRNFPGLNSCSNQNRNDVISYYLSD